MRVEGSEPAAIFAGGFAGALARVALAEQWPANAGTWPWVTFAVNIAGALLLGLVVSRMAPSPRRSLLATGFCGALTTFSAMQLELLQMLNAGHHAVAATYALVSVAAGLAAVALATRTARRRRA